MAAGPFMDQAVHKVAISGAILAHILQDFNASRGDCDGVLFGHLQKTISPKLEDDDDQSGMHEELTAVITGFFCSGSICSFYDACGRIIPSKLAKLLGNRGSRGGDPIIGWLSGRHNTPMTPSLRETAVTRYLRLSGLSDGKEGSATSAEGGDLVTGTTARSRSDSPGSAHILGSTGHVTRSTSRKKSSPSRIGECSSTQDNRSATENQMHVSGGKASAIDLDLPTSNAAIDMRPKLFSGPQTGIQDSSLRCTLSNSGKSIGVLPSSPCLFMLLMESGAGQAVHDHGYRVYQYHITSERFEPRTLRIVNIGPAFRVQYDSFSPVASFPLLYSNIGEEGESDSSSTGLKAKRRELHQGSRRTRTSLSREQDLLDAYSEGYNVERLASLVNPDGLRLVPELEDLYSRMLRKLEVLAKRVCETSSALIQQENTNKQLRLNANSME